MSVTGVHGPDPIGHCLVTHTQKPLALIHLTDSYQKISAVHIIYATFKNNTQSAAWVLCSKNKKFHVWNSTWSVVVLVVVIIMMVTVEEHTEGNDNEKYAHSKHNSGHSPAVGL